ncbi:hypothetical protein LXL04_002172 [Taraxacum kok-saghyz]
MNPQPRSSANGFARKRIEKEIGPKLDNKSQPGKSNFNRMTTSGITPFPNCPLISCSLSNLHFSHIHKNKEGAENQSPSRERLVYITTSLIGHQVEVQVIDGSVYSGIFHATNAEKDFGIILKMAKITKSGSSQGQKSIPDSVQKPPSKTLIIPAKDLVQVFAKSVSVTRDGSMNDVHHDDILIDSSISQSRHADLERELAPWVPDDDDTDCPELDNTFERHWNRGWDQFEANATLFGVKSTFNEELYTTKLDRGGPQMREIEREALRIAREIEGEDTHDLHLAEERGIRLHDKFDVDEETKYSSVFRGAVDDENEDVLDSQNNETFGDGEMRIEDNQNATSTESTQKESGDKVTAIASSKSQEKTSTASVSSTSDSGNTASAPVTATASGLSRTSSVGSHTSEKSTLNPHAKEFRLNPNAKSFVPAPLRAASPVSEGSFYYPGPPHMPLGMGMGPAFPIHQPVIFGPQGTPMQPPHTYFHSNAPQYVGQPQPRQMVYMPTYPPEMPYKGRDF